ncbi:hypothetical protein [Algibacter sp. 2305UL17-15]|uniref:hypothetical protein n=1 Tax=Algibacter sp. 2305UL17-15 TaxID=3231268 RepID=UPI00345B28C9
MDKVLELKQKYDIGEITEYEESIEYFEKSELIKELLSDFDLTTLNLLNRLAELSEIPFTAELDKVKFWINKLADLSYCGDGFSLTGKSDDILACYNSMITTILIKLNYGNSNQIQKGIDWILRFQNFERGVPNNWNGSGVLKYGGCMKLTPCFIGVVKALITLTECKKSKNYKSNALLEKKLKKGLEYVLEHNLFKRKTNDKPITKDITKLTYPFFYKTNLIEILRLIKDNNLLSDVRCNSAIEFLDKKKNKDGFWKVNSVYLPKNWVEFDKPKKNGLWLTYEINKLID